MTTDEDFARVKQLEEQVSMLHKELVALKRKLGIGVYCCRPSETSNGWHHAGNCKNWVLTF